MSGSRTLDFDDGFTTENSPEEISTPASEIDVTPAGNLTSENVQDALEELQVDVDNLNNDISDIGTEVATKAEAADLTSHTSNTSNPHAVTKAQVGLSNVDNTSDADKNAAVATLTNKTLTSPVINTPTIDVATLTGQGSTPSTPPSGFYKLYPRTDTGKLTLLDSAGTETSVGSGGTGVNFITNGDAEAGTTGWSTYADAAGTSPVDGTGGTPNVTLTASSTSPLSGNKSFILTKDAANRQGEGASYAFSIDATNKGRVLRITTDYIVNSGTFTAGTSSTDSDVTCWIYDVTNSRLIQPSAFRFLSNSTSRVDQFQAEFQSSSDSTSYRLILHVATTSASAWSLKFDNVSVAPNAYVFGSPVSDWQSYTPTFTGFGTVNTQSFEYRRVGSNLEIRGRFVGGTPTATEARVSLPSGLTSSSNIATIAIAGNMGYSASSASSFYTTIEPSVTYLTFSYQSGSTSGLTKQNGSTYNAGATFQINASLPISGWGSTVQMADQTTTRVVSFQGYKGSNQSVTANVTDITFTTYDDTHGAWNGSQYTVPVSGRYKISMRGISGSGLGVQAYVGGVATAYVTNMYGTQALSGSVTLNLNAGNVLSFRADGSTTINGNLNSLLSHTGLTIERISGPSQIAASETIAASGYLAANQALTANSTAILFTEETDTHGCYDPSTGRFTAQISGLYETSLFTVSPSTSSSYVRKNGSGFKYLSTTFAGGAGTGGTALIPMNAGDYIDFVCNASLTMSGGSTPYVTHFHIKRIGNRG